MTIRKTLRNLVLIGVGALTFNGCNKYPEYHYYGKIGEEQVKFYETDFGTNYTLEVIRKDGTKIKYVDIKKRDLKLEYVEIIKEGKIIVYRQGVVGEKILEEAQKQFDDYLAKILETKQTKGMTNILK